MFAVLVTFQIDPARWDDFLPLMRDNAATSLRDEPGCHRFDVLTDPKRPGEVFLYELYDDRAAFDLHLSTPHFRAFDAAVSKMIGHKDIRTYSDVRP